MNPVRWYMIKSELPFFAVKVVLACVAAYLLSLVWPTSGWWVSTAVIVVIMTLLPKENWPQVTYMLKEEEEAEHLLIAEGYTKRRSFGNFTVYGKRKRFYPEFAVIRKDRMGYDLMVPSRLEKKFNKTIDTEKLRSMQPVPDRHWLLRRHKLQNTKEA